MLRLLFCLLIVAPALARADGPRTIDMTVTLKDLQGKPLKDADQRAPDDPTCSKCPPLTLGHAIANVLVGNPRDDVTIEGAQKAARYALAIRIMNDPKAKLSAEDIVVIKRAIGGPGYGPLVVGPVFALIDPDAPLPALK